MLFDGKGGGEVYEDAVAFNAMTPEELRARYKQVGAWFAEHRTRIGATNQLQEPETATSVRFGPGGPPVVTDGPYIEGKEHRRLRRAPSDRSPPRARAAGSAGP